MRYRGQSHELEVAIPRLTTGSVSKHFEEAYAASFGYTLDAGEIEVVSARLSCRVPGEGLPSLAPARGSRSPSPPLERVMHFGGAARKGRVYSRWDVPAGRRIAGPAVIAQEDTTTVVPPSWSASLDVMGNLELEVRR